MKRIVRYDTVCILMFILMFNLTGCANGEKKVEEVIKDTSVEHVENTTESSEIVEEQEEQDAGPVVLTNFTGGVLIDEPEISDIKFEISSIETTEEGIKIHYYTERDGIHTNSFSFFTMKINGCFVKGDYYLDGRRVNEMGTHTIEMAEDAYYLIPTNVLNAIGFDGELISLEFQFEAGYSAYGTATIEVCKVFIIYPGDEIELPVYDISEDIVISTLYENEDAKVSLTGVEMYQDAIGKTTGQNLLIYHQAAEKSWRVTIKSITVGDAVIQLGETVWATEGEASLSCIEWREKDIKEGKIDFATADFSNAMFEIIVTDPETEESTTYQIPVNLSAH